MLFISSRDKVGGGWEAVVAFEQSVEHSAWGKAVHEKEWAICSLRGISPVFMG